jgi:O-antigen ligase
MRFQRLLTYVLILSMALPLPAQFGPPKPPPGSGSGSWGITIFPFTLVLIPLLIAWAVDHSSRPNGIPQERRRGRDPVLIALLCLIAAATVSVIATHADWRHVSLWVSLFALFAFARYRMPRIIGRRQLAAALCCVMGVLAVISGIQLVTGRPIGAVATFFQHEVRSAQVFSGKGGGSLLKRVQATFFSTDVFAMFLLFVALWLVGVSRTVKSRFVTVTMLGCGVLIALTFSRGVWLATLVTVPLLMIAFIRRRQLALSRLIALSTALLVVVALAFVFAAGTVFARVSSSQVARSAQTRDNATRVATCLISRRPWLGVGYGTMAVRQNNFEGCNPNGNDIRAHNIYVQDWAEQGIFTLLAYLAVGFTMLSEARRPRVADDRGSQAMRVALCFSILAWLMFMGVYATANDFNVMPIWILLGGYSLTMLDTSRRIVEPLGGPLAAFAREPLPLPPPPRELANI